MQEPSALEMLILIFRRVKRKMEFELDDPDMGHVEAQIASTQGGFEMEVKGADVVGRRCQRGGGAARRF